MKKLLYKKFDEATKVPKIIDGINLSSVLCHINARTPEQPLEKLGKEENCHFNSEELLIIKFLNSKNIQFTNHAFLFVLAGLDGIPKSIFHSSRLLMNYLDEKIPGRITATKILVLWDNNVLPTKELIRIQSEFSPDEWAKLIGDLYKN